MLGRVWHQALGAQGQAPLTGCSSKSGTAEPHPLHVSVQPSTPVHDLSQGIAIACWSWKLQLPVAKMLLPSSVSEAASITGAKWAEPGPASSLAQRQPQASPESLGSCVTSWKKSSYPWGISQSCLLCCQGLWWGNDPQCTVQYLCWFYFSLKGLT